MNWKAYVEQGTKLSQLVSCPDKDDITSYLYLTEILSKTNTYYQLIVWSVISLDAQHRNHRQKNSTVFGCSSGSQY